MTRDHPWLDGPLPERVETLRAYLPANRTAYEALDALAARVRELESLARSAWETYRGEPTGRLLIGDMKRLADALTPEEPKP